MEKSGRNEVVDVDGELVTQTDKAWLIKVFGPGRERDVWLPKSIAETDSDEWAEPGAPATFAVPLWFAEENELV